jgi:hypothetical protein
MAYIVSSTIVFANMQTDGRTAVLEKHVDDLGQIICINYMADAGADLNAHLTASALSIAASETESRTCVEISANLAQVSELGSVALPSFIYSTLQENARALIVFYNSSSGLAAVMIGDYLNAQTDDMLIAGSGMTKDEIDSFRSVWEQNSATAAAIRSASSPAAGG